MPLFEYQCKECGHVAEVLERSGSKTRRVCEKCGSHDMEKLLSIFGLGKGASMGSACSTTGKSGFA